MEDFFAPAAFKPAEALVALRRQLRDLKPLVERGTAEQPRYEWRAQAVIELQVQEGAIAARVADKPARSPQWRAKTLATSSDVRGFVDEVKRQLKRWDDED